MLLMVILSVLLALQIGLFVFSGVVMILRCRAAPLPERDPSDDAPATVIVSIAALSASEVGTALGALNYRRPDVPILYAAYDAQEPAARRIAQALCELEPRAGAKASLLAGRDRFSRNPKLDNLEKAYAATATDRVIFADGNLKLPPDYLSQIAERWDRGATVVSAAPIAVEAEGFCSRFEAAVINLSHARWLLAGDLVRIRYAHGKLLCLRKSWLDNHGGFEALHAHHAEDTAASRLAARTGAGLRLVRRPFEMPLGRRSWRQVLSRNLRWRQIRAKDLPVVYLSEAINPMWSMLLAGYLWSLMVGAAGLPIVFGLLLFWQVTEGVVHAASRLGWSPSMQSAILVRDLAEPFLWLAGWVHTGYSWRGERIAV